MGGKHEGKSVENFPEFKKGERSILNSIKYEQDS